MVPTVVRPSSFLSSQGSHDCAHVTNCTFEPPGSILSAGRLDDPGLP